MKFPNKKLQAHLAKGVHLLVAMLLALGPLTDFHGHEEAHACAEIDHQNLHLDFGNHELVDVLDLDSQLTGLDLGHNHDHPWCALCWFVSVNHLKPRSPLDHTFSPILSALLLNHAPSLQRHAHTQQRGPPQWWITT